MPVRKVQLNQGTTRTFFPARVSKLGELRRRLAKEWTMKRGNCPDPAPDIIEEVGHEGNVIHIHVVWDEWDGFEHLQRSETIVDAFVDAHGGAPSHVKVAMGCTLEEAKQMGIVGY